MTRLLFVALLLPLVIASPSAFANGNSDGIERRDTVGGVTIYTVRDEFSDEAEAQPPPPVININTTVKVVIVRRNLRWDLYRRALGHRYTGFIKVYAGPQYPF